MSIQTFTDLIECEQPGWNPAALTTSTCREVEMSKSHSSVAQYGLPRNILVKSKVAPGARYKKLLVIGHPFRIGNRKIGVVCECDCGKICCVRMNHLAATRTTSCGCTNAAMAVARFTTHGYATKKKQPIYKVWCGMLRRCYQETNKSYPDYGGRGIAVCDEWRNDAGAFCNWAMANGYASGLEIDRRDNNGPYAPWNCRFVTRLINTRNRRSNRPVTAFGETKLLVEWAEDSRCQCNENTLMDRINAGWEPEIALTKPMRTFRRKQ